MLDHCIGDGESLLSNALFGCAVKRVRCVDWTFVRGRIAFGGEILGIEDAIVFAF